MILLQESDEIAYRCAFATQNVGYKLFGEDLGILTQTEIIKQYTADMEDPADIKAATEEIKLGLEKYYVYEPDNRIKATLFRMIVNLFAPKIDKASGRIFEIEEVRLFLSATHTPNFRFGVVNTRGPKGLGYKAGRPPKPKKVEMIKKILVDDYGAECVEGYEADDGLGIYNTDINKYIMSHIDKDIAQIPGWHWDHVNDELYWVDEGLGKLELHKGSLRRGGLIFFYAQMLMGDSTDNIPGIVKCGPVTAHKMLHRCVNEDMCWEAVSKAYASQYGDIWPEVAAEVSDLLWMVRPDRLTGRQYLQSRGYL